MSESAIVIAATVTFITAVGVLGWLLRDLSRTVRGSIDAILRITTVADETVAASYDAMISAHDQLVASITEVGESHRRLTVDVLNTALYGHADSTTDPNTTTADPTTADEPPDTIVVDSDLLDPTDVWLPDATIDDLTVPLPTHEVPVEAVTRSGQAGVV